MKTSKMLLFLFPFSFLNLFEANSQVTAYPALEGLEQSRLFSVTVNNQPIWTEKYVSNLDFDKLPDWFSDPAVREPQELHISSFQGESKLEVSLLAAGKPLKRLKSKLSSINKFTDNIKVK
jgi:hypothetical protein